MSEVGFEITERTPLARVAELGYDMAHGAISRDDMLSQTADVLMSLICSSELIADRFSILEQSNVDLLPSAISIVTAGILTSQETDDENVPTTIDEAQKTGRLLRVFLIGLEKGGFSRPKANQAARDEIENFLSRYDGRTSYGAVAKLRYLYRAMNTANVHSMASKFRMYKRATQMATKCGAEIL